ncbi:MAG: GerMN domain-containing protein [Patescibacteria group bacterium]
MNKKIKILILAVLIVLAAWILVRFVISGPEDNWICVNGGWVRHGNPSVDKLTELCPGAANAEKESNIAVDSPKADEAAGIDKNLSGTYQVYFSSNKLDPEVSCIKVFPVIRSSETEKENLTLKQAVELLLKGLTEEEKETGYLTNIPDNVKIKSIKKEGNTVKIDFSKDIEKGVGGSCRVTAIRAQIYWTVINFDKSIRSVIISVEGETETALQP